MLRGQLFGIFVACAALAVQASILQAGDGCTRCGCHECLRPICVRYCDFKEVPKRYYCSKTDHFCVPDRSERCGCKEIPQCGEVFCKELLTRKTVIEKIPVYKFRVEWVCGSCRNGCCTQVGEETPAVEPAPPAPPAPAASPASYQTTFPVSPANR